jgi:hypothetical protein
VEITVCTNVPPLPFLLSLDCFSKIVREVKAREGAFYYLLIASWISTAQRMNPPINATFYYLLIASARGEGEGGDRPLRGLSTIS